MRFSKNLNYLEVINIIEDYLKYLGDLIVI